MKSRYDNRHDAYDLDRIARAKYFTTLRQIGRNRVRGEHNSLADARATADCHGDGRTMIYAVGPHNESILVERR